MEKTLANWLKTLKTTLNAIDGVLTIGKKQYVAARYTSRFDAPKGCANPGPYEREMVIAIGEKPKGKTVFVLEGSTFEWFVSSYMTKERMTPANAEFHPFGMTFQISPWDVGGKVDDGEKTLERVNARFEAMAITAP